MDTLKDYFKKDLDILSIGLNPSLPSVTKQFYFANPRNRFWAALNASNLLANPVVPSEAAMDELLSKYSIGFTDVVKKPTANGSLLRVSDYRQWADVLYHHFEKLQPRIAWFHGKVAYKNFCRYSSEVTAHHCEWGLQKEMLAKSLVFVTPNTSPANAAYSLENLTDWFNQLAELRKACV